MKRVNGIGSISSKIVIVGEAPGADEEMTGIPFIGAAGRLLKQLLNNAGLNFNDCYITNVVKYRPPNNDMKRLKEIGISLTDSVFELKVELSKTTANVIVPLGNTALSALTGKDSITKYRGSILESPLLPTRKVIPTIHPAALLRQFDATALVVADLKRIRYESNFPDFRSIPKRSYIIGPTYSQVITNLNRLLDIKDGYKKISLDIETTYNATYILCVGLSDSKDLAICIPFVDHNKPYWNIAQEIEIWNLIKQILTSPNHYKIIQNAPFEMDVLFDLIGEIHPVYMDTMIGQHLLYSELPKGLDTLCSLYTNEPYYKDDAKVANYKSEALWKYNCTDVCVTYEICEKLEKEIEDVGLTNFLHGYQMPFSKIMWQASHYGIKLDKTKLSELRTYHQQQADEWQKCLNILVGYNINVGSPAQLRKLLYTEMKLPQHIHRKTGKLTTDDDAITRLNKLRPDPIFEAILRTREHKKMLSTYTNDVSDPDGRVRCNWVITGTETGRLSSRKNIRGTGYNLQNIPKHIRDIFIADDGCSFVVGDLSQVEARIVAWLANDSSLKNIFKSGGDVHSKVASWIYKVSPELVTKDQRSKAKSVVHGANYGIGERTFGQHMGIPVSEARWLLNQYYTNFPMIKIWHQSIVNQLQKNRTLTTPFGRRRVFFGWWGDSLFREAYSTIPQATAVDLLGTAMVRIYYQLPTDAIILLQVHDEVVIQCRDIDINTVSNLLKKEVEVPILINGDNLTVPIDIKIGKNWKDLTVWSPNVR